jgi:small subunit ribosomal protein S20
MPNTQSAKKALRQNSTNRKRNLLKQRAYKEALKAQQKLIVAKKYTEATAHLAKTYQALDKATKAGIIAKNKASRLKSRLAHLSYKKESI